MKDWTRTDVLALVGAVAGVAAVVVAVVPALRGASTRLWHGAALRLGIVRRRYGRWFVRRYRIVHNIYLDRQEKLDLGVTYVSLSVHGEDAGGRMVASEVVGNRALRRILVVGDPGSGKSTLLKAYGVGSMRRRRRLDLGQLGVIGPSHEVPFFVPLRHFVSTADRTGGDLARYLVAEILVRQVGMTERQAQAFFRHLVDRRHCLVLLDGLDEVPDQAYAGVLGAVRRFADDNDPSLATRRARMVLTCRRQNFLPVEADWLPWFSERTYDISPFRDAEIFRYLQNLRPEFEAPQSPETFLNAVRDSGTLDLHRTPLVLAMSVGLFLSRRTQEVPSSISQLYHAMVVELLGRHQFRTDPETKVNRFKVRDKHRFLRELALDTAERHGVGQDFTRADLDTVARRVAPGLDDVPNTHVKSFVDEVLQRSGLVSSVSENGDFTFAHRSIHEHLVAARLQGDFDHGSSFLLERAGDPEWNLVTLFFATVEHRAIDEFLTELATRNLPLAVRALAGADASDAVARDLLSRLARGLDPDTVAPGLAAMLAAARSHRRTVGIAAADEIETVLRRFFRRPQREQDRVFGADVEGTLQVLDSLAGANTAQTAVLVPLLADLIPDEPRLVGILWRCLTAPGIEDQVECRLVVRRLVQLTVEVDGFDALQRQLPFDRDFVTDDLRRAAYPFDHGLALRSNLVTLLAWAEHLGVEGLGSARTTNRFLEARAAGPKALASVERAHRRTVGFRLTWPARIYSAACHVASLVAIVATLVTRPTLFVDAAGWFTLPLLLVPGALVTGLYAALVEFSDGDVARTRLVGDSRYGSDGNVLWLVLARTGRKDLAGWLALAQLFLFGFALAPIAEASVGWFVVTGFAAAATYFLTSADLCGSGARYYLYRPNPYVDMYEDPRSRHWLVPNGTSPAPE